VVHRESVSCLQIAGVRRYYETLELSSQKWHEGQNDPWPYVNYLLFTLKEAYRELERGFR